MPVQMRNHIAKAGEIDLDRVIQSAQRRFGGKYQSHQVIPVSAGQVAHFAHMFAPDYPAESRVIRRFRAADTNDTTAGVFPKDVAAR